MSADPRLRELRDAHQDERNRVARELRQSTRLIEAGEQRGRREADLRWARKVDACLSTSMRSADDWGVGFCD